MYFLMFLPYALGFSGKATFYHNPNQAPGSCGFGFSDTEFIAALSDDMMKGYKSPHCNRMVKVQYKGKSIVAKLVDTCPTCERTSLDLSAAAFKALENPDVGLIDIAWEFVDEQSSHPKVDGNTAPTHAPQVKPVQTVEPVKSIAHTGHGNEAEHENQTDSVIDHHILQGKAYWMSDKSSVGSCSVSYSETDLVVAISSSYPSSTCLQMLKVKAGDKSVTVKVVDTCDKCDKNSIVLSTAAFKTFASLENGVIDVKWQFLILGKSDETVKNHNSSDHNDHGKPNADQSTQSTDNSASAPKQLYEYGKSKVGRLDNSASTLPAFTALILSTLFIYAL